jgi:hypothetical protein
LTLSPGDRLEQFVAQGSSGVTFRLVLRSDGAGGHEALLEARLDDGTFVLTPPGQEVALPNGWHRVRLEWRAGAGNGSLSLSLDGVLATELTNLANGNRRIDRVEWGVVGGVLTGASGSLELDTFSSWN